MILPPRLPSPWLATTTMRDRPRRVGQRRLHELLPLWGWLCLLAADALFLGLIVAGPVWRLTGQEFWESTRLGLGALLTSPFGAGLGAAAAAFFALLGIDRRIVADRELAVGAQLAENQRERDAWARERWQAFHDHLWDNRDLLPPFALVRGIHSLEQMVETRQQGAMVGVFIAYLEAEAE